MRMFHTSWKLVIMITSIWHEEQYCSVYAWYIQTWCKICFFQHGGSALNTPYRHCPSGQVISDKDHLKTQFILYAVCVVVRHSDTYRRHYSYQEIFYDLSNRLSDRSPSGKWLQRRVPWHVKCLFLRQIFLICDSGTSTGLTNNSNDCPLRQIVICDIGLYK